MNKIERYDSLKKQLNDIRFKKLESYSLGETLTYPLSLLLFGKINLKDTILSYIKCGLFDLHSFNYRNDGENTLIFTSHLYLSRTDHQETMKKIANVASPCDVATPVTVKKFHIKLYYFYLFFIWFIQMKNINISFKEKVFLIYHSMTALCYKNEIEKFIDFKNYKNVVVRMDGQLFDNIVAQTAKLNGCTTITVQDGFEVGKCEEATQPWQIQGKLRGSVSDYCLCWSPYFKDIIKQTVPQRQIAVPLGITKYIDFDFIQKEKNGKIGVMLDFPTEDNSNEDMIKAVNELSEKINMPYTLRYHPLQKDYRYNDMISGTMGSSENHDNSLSLTDFVSEHDIIIGCNSSSIIEAALINNKVYRFKPSKGIDPLKECHFPLEFNDCESLNNLVSLNKTIPDEYRDYVCGTDDIYNSYKIFFEKLKA